MPDGGDEPGRLILRPPEQRMAGGHDDLGLSQIVVRHIELAGR
jgi:hypothetical protein